MLPYKTLGPDYCSETWGTGSCARIIWGPKICFINALKGEGSDCYAKTLLITQMRGAIVSRSGVGVKREYRNGTSPPIKHLKVVNTR